MEQKDLKKLNRKQLLELLLEQTKRADRLEAKLKVAQKMLKDKKYPKPITVRFLNKPKITTTSLKSSPSRFWNTIRLTAILKPLI